MLKNFAISHQQDRKKTIVIEVPSKERLVNLVAGKNRNIVLSTGIALCHPKDNYTKKVGREVAFQRIYGQTYELIYVVHTGEGRLQFCLSDYSNDVCFTISPESDHVKLEEITKSHHLPLLKEES